MYRKGAEADYLNAALALGRCYEHGRGVDQDKAKAVKWYRKSADSSATFVKQIALDGLRRLNGEI